MNHFLAWWNVENLFNIKNDPDRSEKLERALGKELNGWTAAVLKKKLKNLGQILRQLNEDAGPDLLGVCEVEDQKVLDSLVEQLSPLGRNYKTVHADTRDRRGIDVAFIYDADRYEVDPDEVFSHFVMRRNATRDILQVSFLTKPAGNRLVLLGNHWPSRSGGQLESAPYRMMAAETLAYFHKRILDVHGRSQAVVALGDFNDEPFDAALTDYALSRRSAAGVKSLRLKNPYLLNLMWPLMGQGIGTHYFDGQPGMLDQILVNRPVLRDDSPFEVDDSSTHVHRFDEMTTRSGRPRRFGRPSSASSFDDTGFSDHFPLSVVIQEA